MAGKISEMSDASALDGSEQLEVVQSGANKKVTVNDLLPVQLQEDKEIDLNGKKLDFLVPGDTYSMFRLRSSGFDGQLSYMAAQSVIGHVFIGAYSNSDDGYKFSFFADNQGDGTKNVDIVGDSVDGSIYMRGNGDLSLKNIDGTVSLVVNGTNSTIGYTADTHTFNGVINLPTQTAPASPSDGDIWREDNTDTGLKIRINGTTKTIVVA